MSLMQRDGQTREMVVVMSRAMRKLAAVYFPIYAMLMIVGREFVTMLFTSQYLGSWPIFAVNITLIPFNIIALDPLTRAYKEHRFYLLRVRAATFVAQTAALWFVTTRFGLVEAIAVVVAGTLIERFVIVWKFGRVLGVGWRDARLLKDVGKVGAATLAGAAAAVGVHALVAGGRPFFVILYCGVAFSLVYLAGLLALRVPEEEEREWARRFLSKLLSRRAGARVAPEALTEAVTDK